MVESASMHCRLRIIFVTSVLISSLLSPIDTSAVGLELGPILVNGRSNLSGDAPPGKSWQGQNSYGAGLRVDLLLKQDVRLCLEPSYLLFGSDLVRKKGADVVERTEFEFEYLVLPLILRVTGDGPGVRGFVSGGLELDVLIAAARNDGSGTVDIDDQVKNISPRANFGVGILVPLWGHLLSIEGRISQGLTNAAEQASSSEAAQFPGPSLKLEGLQLWVGYVFALGGRR
jgi:hypothetical protein